MRWIALLAAVTFLTAACIGDEDDRQVTPTSAARDPAIAIVTAPWSPPSPTPTSVHPQATATPAPLFATALTDVEVHVGPQADSFVIGILPSGATVTAVGVDGTPPHSSPMFDWLALRGLGWIRYDTGKVNLSGPRSIESVVLAADRMPLSPAHPVGYRTGIPRHDRVIELIEAQDGAGLRDLIRGVTFPCYATPPQGIGPAPLCGPGCPPIPASKASSSARARELSCLAIGHFRG
jgi:hypothetical protein